MKYKSVIHFPGYGVNAQRKYIVPDRILSFERVSYNGNSGTLIILDNGVEITVDAWPDDVAKALDEALSE